MRIVGGEQRMWISIACLILVSALAGVAKLASQDVQDRYTLKALNGVRFSEFRGYDRWQDVSVSTTATGVKTILGNHTIIKAYKADIPANGQPFPDGSVIVKIEWNKAQNPVSPYFVEVPATLKSVSFIEKDSKRFPNTSGWGYAQFLYDPASKTFHPYGKDALFGKTVCYQCHTAVRNRDYNFTDYAPR
jgi:hypothetical protein